MPPFVPVWTPQIAAALATPGTIAAVAAARIRARTPPNSSRARPRRFGWTDGSFMRVLLPLEGRQDGPAALNAPWSRWPHHGFGATGRSTYPKYFEYRCRVFPLPRRQYPD